MQARAVWRPPWYAWGLAGLALLAVAPALVPGKFEGHWLFITPCLIVFGVLVVRRLWELPPALSICIGLGLAVFSGAWGQIGLGGLPLDRAMLMIGLLAVLLHAPGAAQIPRVQIRNVHLLIAITAMYGLVSAVAAGTLTNETGFLSLVDQYGFVPFIVFLVAPSIFAGHRERNMLLVTLVVVGAYLGLTAIFESLGPHSLVFPRYILNIDAALPGERAGGPFQSSVAEGFGTFACAVAAVIAFMQWRSARARWFAACVGVVCIFGCFLTLERGIWIGAAAGSAVAALMTRQGRRWMLPGIAACVVGIGGALVISSGLVNKATHRVSDQISVWDRQNQTATALRMIEAKPVLGFGWGRYTSDSLEYFRQSPNYPMDGYTHAESLAGLAEKPLPLHDSYLSYAVELGLIGALLWLVTLLCGTGGAIFGPPSLELRPWRLGLVAITVFFLVVGLFNPYLAPFAVLLLWLWAGVATGPLRIQPHVRTQPVRASPGPRPVVARA